MQNETRYLTLLKICHRLVDAVVVGLAFFMAYQIRFEGHVPADAVRQMWLFLPALMIGQVLINWAFGTYRLIWRYIGLTDAFAVARGYFLSAAILVILRFGLSPERATLRVPLSIIIVEFLLAIGGAIAVRSLRRLVFEAIIQRQRKRNNVPRVVLFGAGDAGVLVAKEIASRSDIRPVGFVDDDPTKAAALINGLPVLGNLDDLPSIVEEHQVSEVIICIAGPLLSTIRRLMLLCEQLSVRVRVIPTLEEMLNGKVNIAAFRDANLVELLDRSTVGFHAVETDVLSEYQSKRIMITGAGGSIGSELALQLSHLKPGQLILLDKDENGLHDTYGRVQGDFPIHPLVADMRNPARMERIFSRFRPEIIFHAAAHKHVHLMEVNPCEAILNNVVGTRNLVEASVKFGVHRFLLVSTDKAVKPTSIMGASKRVCEMIVQSQRTDGHVRFSTVRFGNVVGSRGSVVPIFQRQIAKGGPVTITHADVERYLMTIPEAVMLLIQACTLKSCGEVFLLEMGKPVPIQNLAHNLIHLSGLRPGRDIQLQVTQLRAGEKLTEELMDGATEHLLPTRFEKIYSIHSKGFDHVAFWQKLVKLEEAAAADSIYDVYRILRSLDIGFEREFVGPHVTPSSAVSSLSPLSRAVGD